VPLAQEWNYWFSQKVDATGGWLTNPSVLGDLTLGNTPTQPLHAASKAYVDALIAGGGVGIPEAPTDGLYYCRVNGAWAPAPTSLGSNITGDLTVSGTGNFAHLAVTYSGGTVAGLHVFASDPADRAQVVIENTIAGDTTWPEMILNHARATSGVMGANLISGRVNNLRRWGLHLGTVDVESDVALNTGSHLQFARFDDTGALLDYPLKIWRDTGQIDVANTMSIGQGANNRLTVTPGATAATPITITPSGSGAMQFTAPVQISNALAATLTLSGTGPASLQRLIFDNTLAPTMQAGEIQGRRNGVTRWSVLVGTADAESGGNTGSYLNFLPYTDAGLPTLGIALQLTRNGTGFWNGSAFTFGQSPKNTLTITPGATAASTVVLGVSGTAGVQFTGTTGIVVGGGTQNILSILPGAAGANAILLSASGAGGVTVGAAGPLIVGSGTRNVLTITPGATVGAVATLAASGTYLLLSAPSVQVGGSFFQVGTPGGGTQNNMTIAPGANPSSPVYFSNAGTAGFQFAAPMIIGGGTNSILTVTPGAGASNAVTLATSGSGGLTVSGSGGLTAANGLTVGGPANNALLVSPGSTGGTDIVMLPSGSGNIVFAANVSMQRPGFNGTAPVAKPAVTGSRGGNAALASLLTAIAATGLLTDSTTA
jgi:hypothetical protein